MATTPVFTVFLNALIGAEPLTRRNAAACVLGLFAMALIVVPSGALPSSDMLPWCLAAFAVPVLYALGSTYVARAWPADMDAIQIAFGGAFAASILLLPYSAPALSSGSALSASPMICLAIAALITALVLEMNLYFILLREAGAVFTSFSSFVMILSGFLAGAVFFGERPSLWIWASVGLFSTSLALIIKGKRHAVAA
jgi:drug/metabolite transporter (DMT)-like permease